MSTVYYIEESVMEKDVEGTDFPEIDVYLFVWDRFRMIAKDFILQLHSNDAAPSSDSISSKGKKDGGEDLLFLVRSGLPANEEERIFIDRLCIECHERMARWHIMMEHHMAHNEEFNAVHKQQNGEQLFRLLKSLDEFYNGSTAVAYGGTVTAIVDVYIWMFNCQYWRAGKHGPPENMAEFCSYYIIYQIDNGKEVQATRVHNCIRASFCHNGHNT